MHCFCSLLQTRYYQVVQCSNHFRTLLSIFIPLPRIKCSHPWSTQDLPSIHRGSSEYPPRVHPKLLGRKILDRKYALNEDVLLIQLVGNVIKNQWYESCTTMPLYQKYNIWHMGVLFMIFHVILLPYLYWITNHHTTYPFYASESVILMLETIAEMILQLSPNSWPALSIEIE